MADNSRWLRRRPIAARLLLASVVASLAVVGIELVLQWRYEGLPAEQHAYLEILDGPLYRDLPETPGIRAIWAGEEGTNGCGPDRLDVRYADYYLYTSAPFCSELINVDGRFGERATINPPAATYEVWMFGGSTTLDIGASDAQTIPSYLSRGLNESLPGGVRVRNFGVTGFQSTQERTRFFEILRLEQAAPAMVVFYDGFNEAFRSQEPTAGAIPGSMADKVGALVDERLGSNLRFTIGAFLSRFYTFEELVRPAWHWLRGRRSESAARLPEEEVERRLRAGVENYLHNLRMVRAVAGAYGADAHFFLQPMLFTRMRLGPDEAPHLSDDWVAYWDPIFRRFYELVLTDERFVRRDDFHDLTRVFDEVEGNVFRDYGHLLPRGNPLVAAAMTEILVGSEVFIAASQTH